MSEQKVIDKGLQEIADKILAELPEELAAATHFSVDEKGERLLLDFAVHVDRTDYPLVIAVVRNNGGDFGNRKEGGKDIGYFFVPKPKPAVETLVKTEESTRETLEKTEQPAGVRIPSLAPSTPTVAESEVKASIDSKPEEKKGAPKISDKIKQLSPLTFFSKNHCENCESLGDKCNTTTTSGREYRVQCLDTLKIDSLELIAHSLEKISQKIPEKASSGPVSSPQPEKVQRSTRPTEGHREGDIVWIWAENQGGERYEKALEKDNQRSNDFFAMRNMIVDAEKAGKKGLVLEGKWCWLSKQRDYIGRKPAKEFPKGGRR